MIWSINRDFDSKFYTEDGDLDGCSYREKSIVKEIENSIDNYSDEDGNLCEYDDENEDYYVYAFLDPRTTGPVWYAKFKFDYEPFYIGKGRKNRKRISHRKRNKYCIARIYDIESDLLKPISKIIEGDLAEEEALSLEKELISAVGRQDLGDGPLTNLSDGGESGGPTGYILTDDMLEVRKENWLYRKEARKAAQASKFLQDVLDAKSVDSGKDTYICLIYEDDVWNSGLSTDCVIGKHQDYIIFETNYPAFVSKKTGRRVSEYPSLSRFISGGFLKRYKNIRAIKISKDLSREMIISGIKGV